MKMRSENAFMIVMWICVFLVAANGYILHNRVDELKDRVEQIEESRAVSKIVSDVEQRAERVRAMRRSWVLEDWKAERKARETEEVDTVKPPYGNY